MKNIKKLNKVKRQEGLSLIVAILFGLIFVLISCHKPKPDPVDPPDPPKASTLKIDSLKIGTFTENSLVVNFGVSSNYKIATESLTNNATSESKNVLGKNTETFTNLTPGKDYSFTLNVKDESGKTVSQSVTGRTSDKKSAWVKSVSVIYTNPTLMDRNTQSDTLKLKIVNNSSAIKTLDTLVVDFGTNGEAVKMLRFRQQDTASWSIIKSTGTQIKFVNLKLSPGENVIPGIFAIKRDPPTNIANNAPLTLKVVSIDDGEGGTRAIDNFSGAIPVGSVNTVTEPTYIDPTFGIQYQTSYGNISIGSNGQAEPPIASIKFKFSGPNGAKIKSVRLYNPYHEFQGLVYSNWKYSHVRNISNYYDNFNSSPYWELGQKCLTLSFANTTQDELELNQWGNYNQFDIRAKIYNPIGNADFESYDYTPGEYEWYLLSPFDLVLLDVNGQPIDMSSVPVSKDS